MHIICRYNEISLKGKNRSYFENILISNITERLQKELPTTNFKVKKITGRILVSLPSKNTKEKHKDTQEKLKEILQNTFGIANFSFATEVSQDLQEVKKALWSIAKDKTFETFRVTTQRSNKNFPMTSEEVNREVGAFIWEKSQKKVKLKNPDLECFIEIVEKTAFVYVEKIQGAGGMPVNSSGKALTLLSGGIDSPVAAYYGLKRGVKMDFIHFHSLPYTSTASNEKVEDLAKKLLQFQISAKIFMVPFAKAQQEIIMNCPEKFRVILYRRMMMRIAEQIAEKNKYLALYTGESVAQVASQTLENIRATEDATNLPILRPLVGFDKEEIIEKAKQIDTFNISILPHEDCCTRFIPKHPETRANLEKVREAEKNLNIEKIIETALAEIEIEKIN